MKLSRTKEIYISPIKRLYTELNENLPDRKTIAVILSMENILYPELKLLDALHIVEVQDTEIENNPYAFDYEDGRSVKKFLESENDFERLYVCCDSGESRSTAMAASIMRYYGISDKEIWENPHYHPNLLVYKKQLESFGIKVNKIRMKYLKYVNNRALKNAIKKNRKERKTS